MHGLAGAAYHYTSYLEQMYYDEPELLNYKLIKTAKSVYVMSQAFVHLFGLSGVCFAVVVEYLPHRVKMNRWLLALVYTYVMLTMGAVGMTRDAQYFSYVWIPCFLVLFFVSFSQLFSQSGAIDVLMGCGLWLCAIESFRLFPLENSSSSSPASSSATATEAATSQFANSPWLSMLLSMSPSLSSPPSFFSFLASLSLSSFFPSLSSPSSPSSSSVSPILHHIDYPSPLSFSALLSQRILWGMAVLLLALSTSPFFFSSPPPSSPSSSSLITDSQPGSKRVKGKRRKQEKEKEKEKEKEQKKNA